MWHKDKRQLLELITQHINATYPDQTKSFIKIICR